MNIRVVNIRTGEPYDVYCGRAGNGHSGRFGNPHRVSVDCFCPQCRIEGLGDVCHAVRGSARKAFKATFARWIQEDVSYRRDVLRMLDMEQDGELRLGCFCGEGNCHVDIIADYLRGEVACRTVLK